MNPIIDAIIFDVGGTLRAASLQAAACHGNGSLERLRKMQQIMGETGDPLELEETLRQREQAYREWCLRTLEELNEFELWRQYLLPEYPADFLRQNAVHLNQLWRTTGASRILPDAAETIRILASRGYKLAIISNTTSSIDAPALLEENDLSRYFDAVLLSCTYGRRKPHPAPFLEACRRLGLPPQRCAYVGNSLARDLVGGRQAGFGEVIIIDRQGYPAGMFDPEEDLSEDQPIHLEPDHRIGRLDDLLRLYPHRRPAPTPQSQAEQPVLYDAALSTMWWSRENDTAAEFCAKARQLGFVRIELNHQISPAELASFDFKRCYAGSLHDPCPAVISLKQQEREDRQIASTDDALRRSGVDILRRTIDEASRLGARQVVIHPGRITGDHSLDDRLRVLFRSGQKGTPAYESLRDALIADRQKRNRPHLDALLQSMHQIVEHARGSGLILGLENRYHYYELPIFEEMQVLLDTFPQPWVGWQLDVGHIQAQENLGLMSFEQWLEHFGPRIAAVHLMDIRGLADHALPGRGEVDFKRLAGCLPAAALRTVEVNKDLSPEELRRGLALLESSGCVRRI